jgi:hypothetical protein
LDEAALRDLLDTQTRRLPDLDVLMKYGRYFAEEATFPVLDAVYRWFRDHESDTAVDAVCSFLLGYWMLRSDASDDLIEAVVRFVSSRGEANLPPHVLDTLVFALALALSKLISPVSRGTVLGTLRGFHARGTALALQSGARARLDEIIAECGP